MPPPAFDQFAVLGPLGRGGMGHVYLARDTGLDRKVALKFMSGAVPRPELRERFRVEARAIARLAHPNVVSIFRIGEVEDRPYIAYELVEGQSLDRVATPMPWQNVLRIAVGLSRGLEAVHRAGILHRDIKPANLMLGGGGVVKLLDFGLAKLGSEPEPERSPDDASEAEPAPGSSGPLTRPGMLMGTPAYLAPELWLGEDASPASDVHSLGLVLYELLTGALPHASLSRAEMARTVVSRSLPPVRTRRRDVPESFADVIDRCLRREPSERYGTGAELRAGLDAVRTVFLPLGGAAPAEALEPALVQRSLARASVVPGELTRRLYARLFAAHPEVRALFPSDLTAQQAKLAHVLRLIVDGLGEPERLAPLLEDLGRRHAGYRVPVERLESFGEVLLGTLRELDAASWDDALERAWQRAFELILAPMLRGYRGAQSTAITELPLADTAAAPAPLRGETAYVETDHGHVAYQCLGAQRDLDVLVVPGALSCFEAWRSEPEGAELVRALGELGRVVLFDRAGLGASDRIPDDSLPDLDEEIEHLDAILEASRSRRALVVALGSGTPLALLLAALRPDRVAGVVVEGAAAYGDAESAARLARRAEHWGKDPTADTDPGAPGSPRLRRWLASWERMTASPRTARAHMARLARTDVRAALPFVTRPVLVLDHGQDGWAGGGATLAGAIPGASIAQVEGTLHVPFSGGPDVAMRIVRFARELADHPAHTTPADAALATWALTDLRPAIVPSRLRARLADERSALRLLRIDRPGLAARELSGALSRLAEHGGTGRVALACTARDAPVEQVLAELSPLLAAAPPGTLVATPMARGIVEGTTSLTLGSGAPGTELAPPRVSEPSPTPVLEEGSLERVATLEHRSFSVRADGGTLRIEGSMTLRDPERLLFPHFERIHAYAAGRGTLTVDLRKLEHINSSGLGLFIRWIGWIRAEPDARRYRLIVIADSSVLWQRANLLPLEMIAPEVLEIVRERT